MKALPMINFDSIQSRRNTLILRMSLVAFVVIFFVSTILFVATGSDKALLVGGVAGAVWVLIAPHMFRKEYDLFEPLSFIVFTTLMGTFLRTLYILFVNNDNTTDYLMLSKPPQALLPAVLIILLGLTSFTVGYSFHVRPFSLGRLRFLRQDSWSVPRLTLVVVVLSLVSFVAIFLYTRRLGISITSLSDLSAKRRLIVEGAAEFQFASLGYYLWGAELLSYVFYVLFAILMFSKRKLISPLGMFTLLTGALAVAFPIITSSRTEVLLPLIYALMMWHYLRQKISPWMLFGVTGMLLSALVLLGALRAIGQGNVERITEYVGLESVLGSRHWLDISKTAHILQAIPEKLDYEYGATLMTWLVAPIPRTLWPEKPIIRSGQVIGQVIYPGQFVKTGVPPGFIGELYWNFGVFGVIAGMFYLGLGLKVLYRTFASYLTTSKNALLLYMTIMVPFALSLLGGDLSGIMISVLISTATILLIILFIHKPSRRGYG